MADNTTLNTGTGGDVIATDDVAGVKYPRTKITTGADGVAGGDVTATNPLDVRIGDATTTASVKAASTAAVATDKALVVAVSPNNTVPVSGPLTDTQIRATALPVSGPLTDTQIRATALPISAASMPLPTGASTETTLSAMSAKLPATLGQKAMTASQAVVVASDQSTLPVSAASLPLPTGASTETTLSAMSAKLPATLGQKAMTASQAVVIASDQSAVPVTAPTLTKGTQGAAGWSTQPLRDSGRTLVSFTASAVATVAAEALISLTPYRDLVAGGSATTFAVTSGKKLRLQSIIVTVRATSTVNVGGIVRLRLLAATVLVTSPVHASIGCMASNLATAVVGNALTYHVDIPEGFELSGTMQLGLTQLFSATTATIDVHVLGYEY